MRTTLAFAVAVASLVLAAPTQATFLGDLVYCDVNADGMQNGGEPGLDGVEVGARCVGADGTVCFDETTTTGTLHQSAVDSLQFYDSLCGTVTTWDPTNPAEFEGRYLFEVFTACAFVPGPWTCTVAVNETTVPGDCNVRVTPNVGGFPADNTPDGDFCDAEDGPFPEGQPLGNAPVWGGCEAFPDAAPGDAMYTVTVSPIGDDECNIYNDFGYTPAGQPGIGCRFTGGGVDTDGNWDHTLEDGSTVRNGAGNLPEGIDRYQFGGQAGARTAQQPQPSGEWTHHQQTGPSGAFTFHGGTSSAPTGTEIDAIRCSDPGFCFPARPAPAKQLDFDGVGTFKSIGRGSRAPTFEIPNPNVTAEGNGNQSFDGTFHWFEVNIDDLGEPGRNNTGAPDPAICPDNGFGEMGDADLASCDCPDFYRITIYDGVDGATLAASGPNTTTVIYRAFGYIDGGNLQIHPPTGFDR